MANDLSGGARPSVDLTFESVASANVSAPPQALIRFGRPVLDQKDVPCCVSITVATAMEILDARHGGVIELSPLFNYFAARPDPSSLDNIPPALGFRSAIARGISSAAAFMPPFTEAGAMESPGEAVYVDARQHRIAMLSVDAPALRRITPINDHAQWKLPIASQLPVIFGFWVTDPYRAMSGTGISRHGDPAAIDQSLAHACVAIGYSDEQEELLIRDSRGTAFGDSGHWRLPYHLLDTGLVFEAWVITAITYDS